jgi:hypothetical protein
VYSNHFVQVPQCPTGFGGVLDLLFDLRHSEKALEYPRIEGNDRDESFLSRHSSVLSQNEQASGLCRPFCLRNAWKSRPMRVNERACPHFEPALPKNPLAQMSLAEQAARSC